MARIAVCWVIAGKDQNAINKALACHRKPINVSDLTDTGP